LNNFTGVARADEKEIDSGTFYLGRKAAGFLDPD
jgi:hypothetical protein